MKLIKTRYAVINALFVGALLSTGCPGKTGPAGTGTQVSVKGTKARPKPQPGTNPDASKPTPTPMPTGTPDGPVPQIPLVPSPDPTATPDLPPITAASSLLGGLVAAPAALISNNGGSIISNNGSAIISNNGGAIISNNGGAIISNNGGAIISNNGLGYHVFDAAGPEGILKNAFLYLTDRDEKFFLDSEKKKVFTATTDANGNYRFDISTTNGFPVNKDVVVNALINGNLRMTGYLVPIDGDNQLKLNLATTLATEYLRADAYRNGKTLRSYNRDLFYTTASMTQQAINTGDISAVATVKNHDGTNVTVGTFDLRIDHVFNLRNQYAIAISAVSKANATIKAISDNWKTLLGYRPSSVTTFAGNGNQPSVNAAWTADYSAAIGGVEGDWNVSGKQTPAAQVPLGYVYDVAVAKRGDIFLCGYTEKANSGFVRWIKPNGEVSSLWLPTYTIGGPTGICVETEPTDPPAAPGTVLVTDHFNHRVLRIPIVDYRPDRVGGDGYEQFKMEIVAGYDTPYTPGSDGTFVAGRDYTTTSEFNDPENPCFVDCKRNLTTMNPIDIFSTEMTQYDLNAYPADYKNPEKWGLKADPATPLESRWRLRDEGERVYETGNTNADGSVQGVDAPATGLTIKAGDKVPHPARYAFLNEPWDVCVDDLGNIYIADKSNHRVRMIPKVDGQYFGYCTAHDDDTDGVIDRYDTTPATMKAGCIYTIVGDPTWDAGHTKTTNIGGYWFGEYLLNGSPSDSTVPGSAQKAHLDQPYSVAFDNTKHVLYICDRDNERIRAVSRDTGAIWTAAGNTDGMTQRGTTDRDYAPADLSGTKTGGDGGSAKLAQLAFPKGITVDGAGRLYISDTNSGRIRMVDANGNINTIAGRKHDPNNTNPTDNVTDGDSLLWVDLWDTEGLAVDKDGNVLMCDFRHRRIRKLWRQWE